MYIYNIKKTVQNILLGFPCKLAITVALFIFHVLVKNKVVTRCASDVQNTVSHLAKLFFYWVFDLLLQSIWPSVESTQVLAILIVVSF